MSLSLEYPWENKTVYSIFKDVAENNRDKLFIQNGEESILYGDLLDRVNSVSQAILSLDLDIESPIAVNLPSSVNWAIVVMAILKSGHFYLPIDPDFPEERNYKILLNSKSSVLITQEESNCYLDIKSIPVDFLLNFEPTHISCSRMNSKSKACIIYTSGSTGQPKGVIQTHQSILHGAWRRSCLQKITKNDRMTWLYSPSVKASEYCFFVALVNGASLYIRKIMDHFEGEFITWIESNKITVFHSVASYFRYVGGALETANVSLEHLRLVILGGERVLKSDVDLFLANFPDSCRLFTGLGSTETGTISHLPFSDLSKVNQSILPIGIPVDGMKLELLSEDGESLKSGVGRISVSSRYISPGYWNESSEDFMRDPETDIIRYVSGDMAEIDQHGIFHHRGRVDNCVKVKGYLVNLLEVEKAIMQHEGVHETIVLGHEVDFQTRLYAFIQSNLYTFDIKQLTSFLEKSLTKHMLPTGYHSIEKWPRLENGKINRKALMTLTDELKDPIEKEMTELEEQVLAIWKKVLSVNNIAIDQAFTDVGGDSLATLNLALQFKKSGFTSINLVDLIGNNTISKQAALIKSKSLPDTKQSTSSE